MKLTRLLSLMGAAIVIGLVSQSSLSSDSHPVSYPDDYRDWHHIKSMVIQPGHALEDPFEGIHHIYANDKALAGLRTGRYANGAKFVFDLLQQQAADNAITEGSRKLIGVMVLDDADYAATGGWGFEAFAGDSHVERVVTDGGQGCFGCHQAVKADSFVFTKSRD